MFFDFFNMICLLVIKLKERKSKTIALTKIWTTINLNTLRNSEKKTPPYMFYDIEVKFEIKGIKMSFSRTFICMDQHFVFDKNAFISYPCKVVF